MCNKNYIQNWIRNVILYPLRLIKTLTAPPYTWYSGRTRASPATESRRRPCTSGGAYTRPCACALRPPRKHHSGSGRPRPVAHVWLMRSDSKSISDTRGARALAPHPDPRGLLRIPFKKRSQPHALVFWHPMALCTPSPRRLRATVEAMFYTNSPMANKSSGITIRTRAHYVA